MKLVKVNDTIDAYNALKEVADNYTILLDSCIRVSDTGDYSLLVFNPEFVVSGNSEITNIIRNNSVESQKKSIIDFMQEFQKNRATETKEKTEKQKKEIEKENQKQANGLPQWEGDGTHEELIFNGGFVGYLSYDFGMDLLGIEKSNAAYYKIPEVCFGYYEEFLLVDWINKCTYIHTENNEIIRTLTNIDKNNNSNSISKIGKTELVSNYTEQEFENCVEKVRQYIKKGDVYQVNISQQFRGKGKLDSLEIYKSFRTANYGPYNAFVDMKEFSILSTSPEQFIRVRNGEITSRPIKGTIRKSNDKKENDALKKELLDSEKNRAELLMIIDLERNDLSKICIPGSVKVEKLYEVEEYATVNHIVSTIKGVLLKDSGVKAIVKAMFPGGSITGAPKIRSMEIIEELENTSRGIYTGSIGYISNNGNMDFNIAIRTAIINDEGVVYNVGGGITWDSDPIDEFEETLHKGKAIYHVLTGGDL
jgi:para-aminobenzoate synthetase component I